jgi:hypothetical protein
MQLTISNVAAIIVVMVSLGLFVSAWITRQPPR